MPAVQSESERRAQVGATLRFASGSQGVIEGYAAVFDAPSVDMGFIELVRRGAFSRAISQRQDVRALVEHDPQRIIGRTAAGTLQLHEDARGLHARIELPDTSAGRDVRESIRRGDLTQMSFAFRTMTDRWYTENGVLHRDLLDVDLLDVSVVAYPAYPDTTVAQARAAAHRSGEERAHTADRIRRVRLALALGHPRRGT